MIVNNNTGDRDIIIPTVKPYELKSVKQSDGTTHLWYGVTNDSDHNKAVEAIMLQVNRLKLGDCCALYDFRMHTQVGARSWFCESGLNVIQNKDCKESSTILDDNKVKYERVYWFVQDKI